jgi:hypothetical protein
MAAQEYPGFNGWTVEHRPARNELRATKDHPDAPNGRMLVRVHGADLDRAYLVLKQDAYAEEYRVTQSAESEALAKSAARALVIDKVRQGLARGFGEEYAIKRLREAGCSTADVMSVLGEGAQD